LKRAPDLLDDHIVRHESTPGLHLVGDPKADEKFFGS
jgi:hypothetical protein